MTSAPRSASTWVPNGPAPNCETARMRTPCRGAARLSGSRSVISVRERAFAERGMVLLRHQHLARVAAHPLAALVDPDGLDGDDPAVALARLPQLDHGALGIERVADERRVLVPERVHLQVGDRRARHVGLSTGEDDVESER